MRPKQGQKRQILNGTIYLEAADSLDPGFTYCGYAALGPEAKEDNPVWTIWRKFSVTGQVTCPYDSDLGAPRPDGHIWDNRESIGYWLDIPVDEAPEGFQYIIDNFGQYLKDLDSKEFLIEEIV